MEVAIWVLQELLLNGIYGFIIITAVIYVYQIYKHYSYSNVPGPFPLPLIGNANKVGLDLNNLRDTLMEVISGFEKHGIAKFQESPFLSTYVIFDPKLLEELMTSPTLIEKSQEYNYMQPWLGDGLLLSKGKKWHNRRKILTPAFHFGILDGMISVFNNVTDNLISKWASNTTGDDIRIDHDIELCTLDIICEAIMGVQINAQQQDEATEYVNATFLLTRIIHERIYGLCKRIDWIFNLTQSGRMFKKCCQIIHKSTDDVIKSRRKVIIDKLDKDVNFAEDYNKGKKGKMCFLDILLMSKNADGMPFSDQDIREEVNTFMFEGHDTISTVITFTLYELSQNFKEQEKVYQEILDVCGKKGAITLNHIQDMKYMEMAIKESMRLYPAVPTMGRSIDTEIKLGEYTIPKNVSIAIPVFYIHRKPSVYEDPDTFRPERFLDIRRNPFAYIPFSAGSRNCIGQRFAMLEMKTALAKILRVYKLLPADSSPPPHPILDLVLKSVTGVHLKLRRRNL